MTSTEETQLLTEATQAEPEAVDAAAAVDTAAAGLSLEGATLEDDSSNIEQILEQQDEPAVDEEESVVHGKTISLEMLVAAARIPRRKGDTDEKYLQKVRRVCKRSEAPFLAAIVDFDGIPSDLMRLCYKTIALTIADSTSCAMVLLDAAGDTSAPA